MAEKPHAPKTIPINVNDGSRTHIVGEPAKKPAPAETANPAKTGGK